MCVSGPEPSERGRSSSMNAGCGLRCALPPKDPVHSLLLSVLRHGREASPVLKRSSLCRRTEGKRGQDIWCPQKWNAENPSPPPVSSPCHPGRAAVLNRTFHYVRCLLLGVRISTEVDCKDYIILCICENSAGIIDVAIGEKNRKQIGF